MEHRIIIGYDSPRWMQKMRGCILAFCFLVLALTILALIVFGAYHAFMEITQ